MTIHSGKSLKNSSFNINQKLDSLKRKKRKRKKKGGFKIQTSNLELSKRESLKKLKIDQELKNSRTLKIKFQSMVSID